MAAVEVDGLVKAYAGRRVVDGVTFSVQAGELVALLGPNGAGKTTTVETIEGYRRPDRGTVRVLGADPATAGPPLRARVGLMLQGGGGVDPRLSAAEVLRLHARFHEPAEDPDELLRRVGLGAVGRTRFRRLSGGARARLALALALVGRPEVLLLDEPTAGLDPAGRAETRTLLRTLRDGGAAVLVTTHDLGDVERIADRVVILSGGRVVADGPPGDLGDSSDLDRSDIRVRFTAPPPVADFAAAVRAVRPAATLQASGDREFVVIDTEPDPRLIAAISAWAAERGLLIAELHAGPPSLEARYLALTGDTAVERTS